MYKQGMTVGQGITRGIWTENPSEIRTRFLRISTDRLSSWLKSEAHVRLHAGDVAVLVQIYLDVRGAKKGLEVDWIESLVERLV